MTDNNSYFCSKCGRECFPAEYVIFDTEIVCDKCADVWRDSIYGAWLPGVVERWFSDDAEFTEEGELVGWSNPYSVKRSDVELYKTW